MNHRPIKTMKILLSLLLVAVLSTGCFSLNSSKTDQILEYLDLGDKYLIEMNYEEALLAYEAVIQLDPKRIEAYDGMAGAYEGLGNYAKAAETLEQGIAAVGTDAKTPERERRLLSFYQTLAEEALHNGDDDAASLYYSKVQGLDPDGSETSEWLEEYRRQQEENRSQQELAEQAGDLALEIGDSLDKENYEYLYSLIWSDRFQEIKSLMDQMDVRDSVIFDTPNGKVGIYNIYEDPYGYMLYYGDYNGETREGNGAWIGYAEDMIYCAVGSWKDDKPNGHQTERIEYEGGIALREYIGNTVNGLWDGPVHEHTYDKEDDATGEAISGFILNYTNGYCDVLRENENGPGWVVSESYCEHDTTEKEPGETVHYVVPGPYLEITGIEGFF